MTSSRLAGGSCKNGQHTNSTRGRPHHLSLLPLYLHGILRGCARLSGSPDPRRSRPRVSCPTILGSAPVYETGFSGVQVTYPLNVNTTAINLQEPEALAISGLDKEVYIADFEAGVVYSAAGLNGAGLTQGFDRDPSLSRRRARSLWMEQAIYILPTSTLAKSSRCLQKPVRRRRWSTPEACCSTRLL